MGWPQKGDSWRGDYRMNLKQNGTAGVGVLLDNKMAKVVDSYLQFSESKLLVRIKPKPINTVQTYMQIYRKSDPL